MLENSQSEPSKFYDASGRELNDNEFEFRCVGCWKSATTTYDRIEDIGFPEGWTANEDGPLCETCRNVLDKDKVKHIPKSDFGLA